MTAGNSRAARKEMPSCLRLIPGLEEEVIALPPAMLAPITMLMAAISLSAWMKTPPSSFESLSAMYSGNSFWGVMGYPKVKAASRPNGGFSDDMIPPHQDFSHDRPQSQLRGRRLRRGCIPCIFAPPFSVAVSLKEAGQYPF